MILANVIYSFIVMATVVTIINYDHTVITIENYDPKTFIEQATGSTKMYFLLSPGTSGNAWTREYQRGKYHCTVDLLFDWFGIICMTTDIFLAKQTNPNQ